MDSRDNKIVELEKEIVLLKEELNASKPAPAKVTEVVKPKKKSFFKKK